MQSVVLFYLGTSWSAVSLSSIQTAESLHTKSISIPGSSTATGRILPPKKIPPRLTLCPLMPGSPAVPGIPRAPWKKTGDQRQWDLQEFQLDFLRRCRGAVTHRGTSNSTLTWATRLAGLTLFQTKANHEVTSHRKNSKILLESTQSTIKKKVW